MKLITYVLDGENKTLLDEYIANNTKDFSTNQKKIKAIINIINSFFKLFKVNLKVSKTNIGQRTSAQNSAYWLWLTWIAKLLEEQNIYATNPMGGSMEWTKEVLHYTISYPIIFKEFGKVSTTQLTTKEIDFVVDRYVETFKEIIVLPKFPSQEGKLMNELYGAK